MQISKNICIFSLDSLDAANFEDFFLIKSNYTYFFLRKTQLNNKMFTQSKCPISRQEHDFLIVNLELVPVSLRNLLIFAENKSDFDNFLHRLIKGSSYAKVTENSEIAKPKDINEIHLAAYTGNISLLKEIIAQDATIDAVDSNGYSPLDLALATSNFSAAKILIDNGVECQSKTFPLLSLARFNFLQSNGCDLAQEIKYFPQQTLIYLSLKIGEICDDGYALFLEAILISGNNIILKEYIKHIKRIKINVYELLYFSVLHNLHNSLKFILNTNSIDINKKRKKTKHQSLLHMACKNGDIETTKILLDHKGDIGCKDYNLSTPLHLACKSNNIELILFLIKKGANIKALSLNDFTPLHQAICASNFDVVKILTENGANIHAKTKNDLSTMYMSVTRFNYNPSQQTLIASYLLSKGFIADSEVIALAFDRRATAVLAVLMEHSSITGEIIDSEGLIFKAINNDMIDIYNINPLQQFDLLLSSNGDKITTKLFDLVGNIKIRNKI